MDLVVSSKIKFFITSHCYDVITHFSVFLVFWANFGAELWVGKPIMVSKNRNICLMS